MFKTNENNQENWSSGCCDVFYLYEQRNPDFVGLKNLSLQRLQLAEVWKVSTWYLFCNLKIPNDSGK